jgi:transposase
VIEKAILACHRTSEVSLRLQIIPGIDVITATAIAAAVADAKVFRSGRHFAAWIGPWLNAHPIPVPSCLFGFEEGASAH